MPPLAISHDGSSWFSALHERQSVTLGERAHRLEAVGFERALSRVGETRSFWRPRQKTSEAAAWRRTDEERPSRRPENSPHLVNGRRPIVGVQRIKKPA